MDARKRKDESLPGELKECHRLIANLQSQVQQQATALEQQATALDQQATTLSLKDKLTQEQAHSVLQLKADNDKLSEENVELNLQGQERDRPTSIVGTCIMRFSTELLGRKRSAFGRTSLPAKHHRLSADTPTGGKRITEGND